MGLYPAIKEGVAILVMAVTMDGKVVYPFTPVKDVPLFGREPKPGEKGLVDGRSYLHMTGHFPLMDHTPLFDRVCDVATASMVEAGRFQDPRSNRTVNIVTMTISDGFNGRSVRTLGEVTDFMEELDDSGMSTRIDMYLGETPEPTNPHYEQVRRELVRYLERKYSETLWKTFTTALLHSGPGTEGRPSLQDLLRWYYGCMGTPADNLLLPSDDPKKFRRAVGQASDLVLQASGVAPVAQEEAKERDDEPTE